MENGTLDSHDKARTYIDSVIEINRRHGMGSQVKPETYEKAVRSAAEAFDGLRRAGG